MKLHVLAALLAAGALAACGFDVTPQSSGSTTSSAPAAAEKPAEGEKKAD
jgi:hypothetical protein